MLSGFPLELVKEFYCLIEEMKLDKMQPHFSCGDTASKAMAAHKDALTAFAAYATHQAVDALSTALISPDVIKACALASRAYTGTGSDTRPYSRYHGYAKY